MTRGNPHSFCLDGRRVVNSVRMNPGTLKATLRSRTTWLFAAILVLDVVIQFAQVGIVGLGHDSDARIYYDYGWQVLDGIPPYVEFSPEYPPASLWVFAAPLLRGDVGLEQYRIDFAFLMGATHVLLLAVVLLWCRRLALSRRAITVVVVLFLAGSLGLSHLVHRRFDIVPTTLVLAALALGPIPASGLLGLATSIKLWPSILLPIPLLMCIQSRQWGRATIAAVAFGVGLILPAVPFLPAAGVHVLDFLQYHRARDIQIESLWALIPFALDSLGVLQAKTIWSHGANHVTSSINPALRAASTVCLPVLCLIPYLIALFRRAPVRDFAVRLTLATATITGFLLGSKVFSPQFMLWLLPFLALAAMGIAHGRTQMIKLSIAAVALPILTELLYLPFYVPLCSGPRAGAFIVAGLRAAGLAYVYGAMLVATRCSENRAATSSRIEVGSSG